MHLTRITSPKRQGFSGKPLHRHKERRIPPWAYLKEKSSFLIAAISLGAFVAGNMIGTHGLYAFMASVWGQYDDSLIVNDGVVPPIARVPNYECWLTASGGGELPQDATYRQVPESCLVPLPPYDAGIRSGEKDSRVYEVAYMGSYTVPGEGKGGHLGIDIAAPRLTPAVAIAAGIVTDVREDKGGFGKIVSLRLPHMPDPTDPRKETVLYASYAHLHEQLVREGDVVRKGQVIGLVGSTGYATGNHLHFQIDREKLADGTEVPWHPYWHFSASEARDAGLNLAQAIDSGFHRERALSATINPMLYVQANHPPVKSVTVAKNDGSLERLLAQRALRKQQRLARLAAAPSVPVSTQTIASLESVSPDPKHAAPSEVRTIEIVHDRSFAGRGWERITVTLRDSSGNAVDGSLLARDLHLRTAYGEAEFRPAVLSPLDFTGGRAEVQMLPRGRRTIVVTAQPYAAMSEPMRYEERFNPFSPRTTTTPISK